MKKQILTFLVLVTSFFCYQAFAQGSTTSRLNGRVVDDKGEPVPGATVIAVHQPSGTQFGNVTDESGFFRIPNMDAGGPYKVAVSFVGFKPFEQDQIYLTLGQAFKLDIILTTQELEGIEVIASEGGIFDGNRTGSQTNIGEDDISKLPTVSRSLNDFTRLTPQATVTDGGGISIAGMNNRFNTIYIDGAVNNDVFGLSGQGTNGGQAGVTPISIDAIEQFQVVVSPYDVRQGGFAGGGVNAVTRSGTNKFKGSAYWLFRNQDFAGKTPTDDPNETREKLADFTAMTYGIRVGGPIKKDKLFFFINAEMQRDDTPQPFNIANYDGDASAAVLDDIVNKLKNEHNYDPGGYANNTFEVNSNKLLVKLDWNINKHHKLMVRHSYTYGEAVKPESSNNQNINFYNRGELFPSTTNSSSIELKSTIGNTMANKLILGYTRVRDDRDPVGTDFPAIEIEDNKGNIYLGADPFSSANQLNQDVITLTNNFDIYAGRHSITVGTHNEFYSIYNLFMRNNFGYYEFSSTDAFLQNQPTFYRRSYSLVDNVTGDGSAAAARFNAMQLGLYVQDEFQINNNLMLTAGVRIDVPIFFDDPQEDVNFNTVALPLIAQSYDIQGARAGSMPNAQVMFSPRIGFNYDLGGRQETQLRGGIGIFTSRLPLVWAGGSYTNNGLTIGEVRIFDDQVLQDYFANTQTPYDPYSQPKATDFGLQDDVPSGQMDLFAANFKFPQVLRTSLAVDQKLPGGITGTLEGLFTKTLNNVVYYNINIAPSIHNLGDVQGNENISADQRPIYTEGNIDNTYSDILLGANTSKGYSYNVTAKLEKNFDFGLNASLAYTYGSAKTINDGTSSQNSSQWRYMEQVNGRNNLDLSYSDFDLGSRIVGFVAYRKEYAKHFASTLSLFYNGQSGQRFSYVYTNNLNGEDFSENDLIYIPANQNEINLVDLLDDDNNLIATPDQQWQDLDAFIENDPYLSQHRGEYAERNASRSPFTHVIDLKFMQDFYIKTAKGSRHTLQLSLDIFNFTNLLNKNWGRRYFVGNDIYELINFEGFEDANNEDYRPSYTFTKPKSDVWNIDDIGITSARWQMQVGVRYIFD